MQTCRVTRGISWLPISGFPNRSMMAVTRLQKDSTHCRWAAQEMHTVFLPNTSDCSPAAYTASQRRKLRQRASDRNCRCVVRSERHRLVSRHASLKRRLTSGTWHSAHVATAPHACSAVSHTLISSSAEKLHASNTVSKT